MKKNFLAAFCGILTGRIIPVVIVLLMASCKKDHAPSTGQVNPVKKISRIESNGVVLGELKYNAAGLLMEYVSGDYKITYDRSGNGFSYKTFSGGVIMSEGKDAVISAGRLSTMNWQRFTQGVPSASSSFVFSYNPDGTLSSYIDGEYLYEFTYVNGDFAVATEKKNGVTLDSSNYEYFTDMPSKFNLPYMEYLFEWPVLTESLLGTHNKHLMKKFTEFRNGNTYVTEFTYERDVNGYVTGYTQVQQKNNEAPVSATYSIFY